MLEQLFVAGKAFPIGPFRAARDLLRRANSFPFRGRNYAYQISFHYDLRIGEAGFV